MDMRRFLALGTANTGKTHYGAQLYGRLSGSEISRLKLVSLPTDVQLFATAFQRLQEGITAPHTQLGTYEELVLRVKDRETGKEIEIAWPDYAGEQLNEVVQSRQIPELWQNRIIESTDWLLFLRLDQIHNHDSIFTRPLAELLDALDEARKTSRSDNGPLAHNALLLPAQTQLIEMLQIFTYIRSRSTPASGTPGLTVLLSCWDELSVPNGTSPRQQLQERAPLLNAFLAENWGAESLRCFGLSALGRNLDESKPDSDYLELGPRHFGYLVLPSGEITADLTIPIAT